MVHHYAVDNRGGDSPPTSVTQSWSGERQRRARGYGRRGGRSLLLVVGLIVAAVSAPAIAASAVTPAPLPCDLFQTGGTSCVAAYSTVRAVYTGYSGSLYQVTRASDGQTANIGLLTTGGYANAATQDAFCPNTVCTITKIYDQSTRHNDLSVGPVGHAGSTDVGARADALPVTVGGHKAYGIQITPGVGYRYLGVAAGVATNGQPESAYWVVSGTYVSPVDRCCFGFGNAEATANDTGNAHMDSLNISTVCTAQPCNGTGPWLEADMENATFMGGGLGITGYSNPSNVSYGWNKPFVTGVLRNNGQTSFALDGGNAQTGSLTSLYNGALPSGYAPMLQEGGIVLGVGGDNSNAASGAFFEGVMTAGYASNATVASVQSSVVAAGYSGTTGGGVGRAITGPGGKCVDVAGNDTGVNLAVVQLNSCLHDVVDQQWAQPADGTLRTMGRCLDIAGNATTNGSAVELYDCNGVGGQVWVQQADGSLKNPQSGRCLDDPSGNTANGTALQLYDCNGNVAQQFRITRGAPIAAPGGQCVDVSGDNNGANGTAITMWNCLREATDQSWLHNADATITTIGRCLNIAGGATTNGSAIELRDCSTAASEKWVQQADGSLKNPQSGRCLDDPSGNTTNGTALQLYDCNGNAAQKFQVTGGQPIKAPAGKCVDVSGDDQYGNFFGIDVQMYDCIATAVDQHWVRHPDNTLQTLTRCLDIRANSTASGAKVELYNCNGIGGQVWIQQANGTLKNPQSGLCLTDPASNTANQTVLDIEACTGAANQQFAVG